MEHPTTADWDSVLQFVAEPLEFNYPSKTAEAPVSQTEDNSQVPTPPLSHDGTPVTDPPAEGTTLVSISTTFYPGAQLNELPPDTVLLASDGVFFYVHASVLLASSTNNFNNLIASDSEPTRDRDPMLSVQEDSTVLNVILHVIYDMSCAHYSPPFPALVAAVNHLPTYGISPKVKIISSTPTFTSDHGSNDGDGTVATSSHLLSFPLATLTDEMAELIGPIYLKRLFFLHFGRSDALKRVLLPPPHPHAPTPWCDFDEQKKLTRAWALASAYLAWDARPDLSTSVMESALRPLADHLTCEQCQQGLRERIKDLLVQWTVVKRTI
ncbi:hypothetical protein AGABI2DRAFT_184545 [Agaricus bisporus var. bisporus H97]|uniref:hypothetical protein n=1 Tax=Agaricus bisporus var. bisporus (strain H97 / ATCC MYA-4626 / FGSC 10389) TaxID=936046 RepID=UPI00029F781D|nr:hypothetical protein AGABI2DRAFT_184545 [Agaricus bisporus var. bisporus H97]EKV48190.1 hypothetical protein AGABI2DRAFT_184545 [Agaricus bisporus var. bisporus H97]